MSDFINKIKNLRDISGAGFLDCKNALKKNDNNIDRSIDFLRKKGLSKALKKSTREAKEGVVGVFYNENRTILIEINTETDFSAKNDIFLDFVEKIANIALNCKNLSEILSIDKFMNVSFENQLISEYFTNIIAKIGENIVLKKLILINKNPKEKIFSYTHNKYRKNIGKICVALKANIKDEEIELEKLGKNLCMHIAACKPLSLDIDDLDKNIINKEMEIQKDLIKSSGKPQNIIDKILKGKMKKFYSEITLLNQYYILDTDKTVRDIVDEYSLKNSFKIVEYSFLILGNE